MFITKKGQLCQQRASCKWNKSVILNARLENGGSYIIFSLLGLWEQMKKEKVALVDGFLVSAITKNRTFGG